MPKQTVAIIGATADREKFGNKSVRAHASQGFEVYPVNPKGGQIEGFQAYTSISEVPVDHLDRVSLYVPPKIGITLLEAIAQKGCDQLWLNPGSESEELVAQARELGFDPITACSIVDVGVSPHNLDNS